MKEMKHYLIWLAVALAVGGGSFFVYKKMMACAPGCLQSTNGCDCFTQPK